MAELKPTHVAVDIDDNLYSFTTLARDVLYDLALERGDDKLRQAAYSPWPEWRSPADLVGLDTWLEVIDLCHTDDKIIAQTPFPGAADVVWKLWREGHKITYISNRREDSDLATGAWLLKNDFPVAADGDVQLVCTTGDKTPHLRTCQYLIDDRPKTLIGFVTDFNWKYSNGSTKKTTKRRGFALQRPYNLNLTDWPDILIAPSWNGIAYYLTKKGVLSEEDNSGTARVSRVAESMR